MKLSARQQDALARVTAAAREIETAAVAMQDAMVELQLAAAELEVAVEINVDRVSWVDTTRDYDRIALAAIARAAGRP